MALFFEGDTIKRYNVTTKNEEPEKLVVTSSGPTHWLVTPNGAALLALRRAHSDGGAVDATMRDAASGAELSGSKAQGWVLDAYALEECLPEQSLFQQIADGMPLADKIAALPALVRITPLQQTLIPKSLPR